MSTSILHILPETARIQQDRTIVPSARALSGQVARTLATLAPTTLSALDAVSLLNRTDTKFLLPAASLPDLLAELSAEYLVLDIDGRRAHQYRTIYLDTPEFALYHDHHAGLAVRHKVRSRTYVENGQSFFEIKTKTGSGRTVKHRFETPEPLTNLTPAARQLLAAQGPSPTQDMQPVLRNDFRRITLAGWHSPERLTLDFDVQFEREGHLAVLPGVVIAELKRSGLDSGSAFARLMREHEIRSTSVSKYCLGVAMLVPGIEHGAFDRQLRAIGQLGRDGRGQASAFATSSLI